MSNQNQAAKSLGPQPHVNYANTTKWWTLKQTQHLSAYEGMMSNNLYQLSRMHDQSRVRDAAMGSQLAMLQTTVSALRREVTDLKQANKKQEDMIAALCKHFSLDVSIQSNDDNDGEVEQEELGEKVNQLVHGQFSTTLYDWYKVWINQSTPPRTVYNRATGRCTPNAKDFIDFAKTQASTDDDDQPHPMASQLEAISEQPLAATDVYVEFGKRYKKEFPPHRTKGTTSKDSAYATQGEHEDASKKKRKSAREGGRARKRAIIIDDSEEEFMAGSTLIG